MNIAALDFVSVARARGESTFYIMLREILPNMVGTTLADFGLRFIYVVLLLSSLAFSASACSRQTPTGARWCGRTCGTALPTARRLC